MANNDEIILLQPSPPKLEEVQKAVFNSAAQDFLVKLHREFEHKIEELYKYRSRRFVQLQTRGTLDFKKSLQREDKDWKIASLPRRLQYVHSVIHQAIQTVTFLNCDYKFLNK